MSSPDGERSPKRQRLESYSPASPPLSLSLQHETKPFIQAHTPPPSVRMSPTWQNSALPTQQQQRDPNGNFPTPPSTAGFLSQMATRGAGSDGGGESERQTPMSDYESGLRKDGDIDAEMSGQQPAPELDVTMVDAEHRRTDHERLKFAGEVTALSIPGAQSLYKLPVAPIARSRPHPSQNLLELFGLQPIQAAVARRDPNTGEKINKMRKSYENKVKALGLEGRNKAQANQGELFGLVDPGWSVDVGNGKTLWQSKFGSGGQAEGKDLNDPEAQQNLFSKLDAALNMLPGRLPLKEHKEWQGMLALDDPNAPAGGRTSVVGAPNAPIGTASTLAKSTPAVAAREATPLSPRNAVSRPERANKKRRYDDDSFEGYAGFEEDGYSTGGMDENGRRGSNAKRQKRKDFSGPSALSNSPSNMVGVRSS